MFVTDDADTVNAMVNFAFAFLLAEADRKGIIDDQWYQDYLRRKLEVMNFKHFAEMKEVNRQS